MNALAVARPASDILYRGAPASGSRTVTNTFFLGLNGDSLRRESISGEKGIRGYLSAKQIRNFCSAAKD